MSEFKVFKVFGRFFKWRLPSSRTVSWGVSKYLFTLSELGKHINWEHYDKRYLERQDWMRRKGMTKKSRLDKLKYFFDFAFRSCHRIMRVNFLLEIGMSDLK